MSGFAHTHDPSHMVSNITASPNSICYHCRAVLTGTTPIPPSPIPDLLGSNAIPSETQGQSIRSTINVALSDVRLLEEKIRHVSSVLSDLQGECRALEEFIDTHQAFLTPARRVYPEIWAEIFKHCPRGSKRRRFSEVEDSFDPKEGPMTLTRVCSTWRTIAIATPQLWTTIRITYKGNSASQYALVKTWIQRSGGLPLIIAVTEVRHSDYPKQYPPLDWSDNDALHALCSSSTRWKELYLMLPASQFSWAAFGTIRHELPSLKHLTVSTSRGTLPHDTVVGHFENAPLLQSISLDYSTTFSMISVPLAQITRLEFNMHKHTPASIHSCLAALDMVPNVQECIFHMGASEPWVAMPTVHHSQLRKLTVFAEPLRDNTQKGLGRFFANLFVPNLKWLAVCSVANARQWDHYAIGHFLSRTPSLEVLDIKCDTIKANELLEELREATAVSSLTLSVPVQPTEELLDYLSSTDAVNLLPFLVQLRSISFEGPAKPEFVYRIRNMIACRTMLAKQKRTANLMFIKYGFSTSPLPQLDYPGHEVDSRESLFTVTKQSASCIFRRRPPQVAALPAPSY